MHQSPEDLHKYAMDTAWLKRQRELVQIILLDHMLSTSSKPGEVDPNSATTVAGSGSAMRGPSTGSANGNDISQDRDH